MFTRKNKKGFTLTELIVVVAILGILTAVAVPMVTAYIDDSRLKADEANAKNIMGVLTRCLSRGTMADGTVWPAVAGTIDTDDVTNACAQELGSVPVPVSIDGTSGTNNAFIVDATTGRVSVGLEGSAVAGQFEIVRPVVP